MSYIELVRNYNNAEHELCDHVGLTQANYCFDDNTNKFWAIDHDYHLRIANSPEELVGSLDDAEEDGTWEILPIVQCKVYRGEGLTVALVNTQTYVFGHLLMILDNQKQVDNFANIFINKLPSDQWSIAVEHYKYGSTNDPETSEIRIEPTEELAIGLAERLKEDYIRYTNKVEIFLNNKLMEI